MVLLKVGHNFWTRGRPKLCSNTSRNPLTLPRCVQLSVHTAERHQGQSHRGKGGGVLPQKTLHVVRLLRTQGNNVCVCVRGDLHVKPALFALERKLRLNHKNLRNLENFYHDTTTICQSHVTMQTHQLLRLWIKVSLSCS